MNTGCVVGKREVIRLLPVFPSLVPNLQKQILARQVSRKMVGKDTEPTNYSTRNASVGFMPEARCAGMSAALSPAEQRTRIVIKITAGSEGFTS